jgi:hypothetical protein
MPFVDAETAQAYRTAWDAWMKQVEHVNRVFLDDEKLRPDQIKGLLNREARAKAAYDAARLRLLGLDESPLGDAGEDGEPG